MKQQDVFRKIGGIIREINEQYEFLAGDQDQLNDLELELLVANAHFLSDHIEVLRKIIAQKLAQQKEEQTFVPLPGPVATAPIAPPQPLAEPVVKSAAVVLTEPVMPAPPVESVVIPTPPVEPVDPPKAQPEIEITPLPVKPEPEPEVQMPPVVQASPVAQQQKQEPDQERKLEPKYFEPMVERVPVYSTPAKPEEVAKPQTVEFDLPKPQSDVAPVNKGHNDVSNGQDEVIRHELKMDDNDTWEEEEALIIADDEDEDAPAPEAPKAPEVSVPLTSAPVVEPPVAKEEPKPEPPKPFVPEPPKLDEVLTFNQRISAQMGSHRMSDQFGGKAITDLKSAISLNDKLLFVKDLFKGYSLAYSEALEILNTRFRSFEEAESFLKTYAEKNNWAEKSATAEKFYNLLRRRYGA